MFTSPSLPRLVALSSLALLGSCSSNDGDTDGGAQASGGSGASQTCGATTGSGSSNGSGGADGSGGTASGGTASGGTNGSGGANGTGGATTTVCDTADEGNTVTLTCPSGLVISEVTFASYGTPTATTCGSFSAGECSAAASKSVVNALCKGKNSCTVQASNTAFGDPCNSTVKSLAVEVSCAETAVPGTLPFKGVANSPCDARKALNVSWYYNWEQNEKEPCADGGGGKFVPMIWGHPPGEQQAEAISTSVANFVSKGYDFVLGFNEPDNSTQANIPVQTALDLLPAFDNPAIKVVSPATAANVNPGQAWFSDFMELLTDQRVDVMGIHWYGWNASSCDASAAQLETYIRWVESLPGERPIWITEWGCLNQSAPDEQSVVDFYKGALAVFARHPRIERYAWYPWATNCGLTAEDGSLTALGEAYAAAPAYRE